MMICEKEYLTVAEYAEIVGITPQAVYQKLNKSLAPFCKEIKGKKYILSSVFQEYHTEEETKTFKGVSTSNLKEIKEVSSDLNKDIKDNSSSLNQDISTILKVFQDQLKEKDDQIKTLLALNQDLQQTIKEKDEQLNESRQQIAGLFRGEQELRFLSSSPGTDSTQEQERTERKPSLWERLFNKKSGQ